MPEERPDLPAVPPDDYKGTIADWETELRKRGHLDPDQTYRDALTIMLDQDEYGEILRACEPNLE